MFRVMFYYLLLKSLSQDHRLSSLAIVEDIRLLNGIFIVTLSSYIIATVLNYIQIWRPYMKST